MPNRLKVPDELLHLIEKRVQSDRRAENANPEQLSSNSELADKENRSGKGRRESDGAANDSDTD